MEIKLLVHAKHLAPRESYTENFLAI